MNLEYSGPLKIATIGNYYDYISNKESYDDIPFIIVKNWQNGLIKYPTKIGFKLKVPESINLYLSSFKSSERSSLKKRFRVIEEKYDYTISEKLTKNDFTYWLNGYNKSIGAKEYGLLKISLEDYIDLSRNHKIIFLADKNTGNMVSGGLFKIIPHKDGSCRLSLSLAWYSDESRYRGSPTFIVLKLIEYCIENNINNLSFGQDRNLYGGHLSIGLHDFKRSWHANPFIPKKSEITGLIINKKALGLNKALYYEIKDNNLIKRTLNYE